MDQSQGHDDWIQDLDLLLRLDFSPTPLGDSPQQSCIEQGILAVAQPDAEHEGFFSLLGQCSAGGQQGNPPGSTTSAQMLPAQGTAFTYIHPGQLHHQPGLAEDAGRPMTQSRGSEWRDQPAPMTFGKLTRPVTRGMLRAQHEIFECEECVGTFKTKDALRKHRTSHKRPLKCPFCPHRSSHSRDLRRHLDGHVRGDKRKRLCCPVAECKKTFTRRDNGKRHFKKQHQRAT